ncbi:MAG: type I-C CRISPR-associated endonuclease Cas1 [Betaproteobacteria bacterium]|nr:type I-C CRISPR-associated endonuclease Cas1 [Betaproteobacteria bacterium]
MQQILNTLYVVTPNAYVHLENDTLRIDVEHEKRLQVPLHHLGSVVCFGNIVVSPALMHRLADDGKSLVLLDGNGRFKARLEGPVSGNILLRRAHHARAAEAGFVLEIAKACVAGKVRNCRQVLLRGARESAGPTDAKSLSAVAEELGQVLQRLERAPDLEALRGFEGDAAKRYFGCLPLVVRPDQREAFAMSGRTRRPPLDRFNALLSFLYSMLMNDCRSAAESVGLDPQLGFLHAVRPGRAALALDLMEEFRPVLADRLALTLVNRKQVVAGDFTLRPGGAVTLEEDARKEVVSAYQERKQELLTHPLVDSNVAIGFLPMLQARFLARAIRGEIEGYVPFLMR